MQQCQDQLNFEIETPDDEELAKRFAANQRMTSEINQAFFSGYQRPQSPRAKAGHKTRNRKSKQQKKQERMNRDKLTNI